MEDCGEGKLLRNLLLAKLVSNTVNTGVGKSKAN
jgi:hypothetical protein